MWIALSGRGLFRRFFITADVATTRRGLAGCGNKDEWCENILPSFLLSLESLSFFSRLNLL